MNEAKKRSRAMLTNLKNNERDRFLSSLPAPESDIQALFDFLDENLNGCDDTLLRTAEFIRARSLPENAVISWLHENGGFCDCEVLANVEDNWNQMMGVK